MATRRREYDWMDFTHGPVTGPLVGVAASTFLAAITRALDAPAVLPLVPAVLGAAAAIVRGERRGTPRTVSGYAAASIVAVGSWATWVAAAGWSPLTLYVLVGLAVVAGLLAPAFSRLDHGLPLVGPRSARGLRTPIALDWRGRIARFCRIPVEDLEIVKVEEWPAGAGYALHGEFAAETGHTWEDVAAVAFRLGSAVKLPPGCRIRVIEGDHQGAFIIEVPLRNALAEKKDYPADITPLTVTKPLPIAVRMNSQHFAVSLRESAGVVIGRRGSGKTNCLHVLTGQLCRCRDVLVWHVDLNGGGLSVPWIYPYANGDVDEPAIDWVAPTPEEAVLMATVALAVVKDRKAAYGRLKYEHNSTLLPVSPTLPEIVIIIDEGAEIMGDTTKAWRGKEMFEEILRIGRAEAVNVIFSGLRATGAVLPGMVLSQAQLRVGCKVKDDADLAYLFGWQKLRSADLTEKGTTFVQQDDGDPPEKMRWYFMEPQRIGEIAMATAPWRPQLDARGQAIGGEVYAQRWERTRPLLLALATNPGGPLAGATPATGAGVATMLPPVPTPPPAQPVIDSTSSAREQAERTTENLRLAVAEAEMGRRFEKEFADLEAAFAVLGDDEPAETSGAGGTVLVVDEPSRPPRHAAILEIVDAAGADGTSPQAVEAALTTRNMKVSRQTVSDDLKKLVEDGELVKPFGKQGLYVTRRYAPKAEGES